MPHLFIYTYFNSSPIACPPYLCYTNDYYVYDFNICGFVLYAVQLKCLGIILLMFAIRFHLLF